MRKYFTAKQQLLIWIVNRNECCFQINEEVILLVLLIQKCVLVIPYGFVHDQFMNEFQNLRRWLFFFSNPGDSKLGADIIYFSILLASLSWLAIFLLLLGAKKSQTALKIVTQYLQICHYLFLIPSSIYASQMFKEQNLIALAILILTPVIITTFINSYLTPTCQMPIRRGFFRPHSFFSKISKCTDLIFTLLFSFFYAHSQRIYLSIFWQIFSIIDSLTFPFSLSTNVRYFQYHVLVLNFSLLQLLIPDQSLIHLNFLPICVWLSTQFYKLIFAQFEAAKPWSPRQIQLIGEALLDESLAEMKKTLLLIKLKPSFPKIQIHPVNQTQNVIYILDLLTANFSQYDPRTMEQFYMLKAHFQVFTMQDLHAGYIALKYYRAKSETQSRYYTFFANAMLEAIDESRANSKLVRKSDHDILVDQFKVTETLLEKVCPQIMLILDLKIEFWAQLIIGYQNLEEFQSKLNQILRLKSLLMQQIGVNLNKRTDNLVPNLKKMNCVQIKLLSLIYSNILNDSVSTKLLENQFQEQLYEERFKELKLLNNQILNDELLILQLSLVLDKGKILSKNRESQRRFFKYPTLKEYRAVIYVNQLMPNYISSIHNQLLDKYLETGSQSLFERTREVFAQSSDGFLMPITIKLMNCLEGMLTDDIIITGRLLKQPNPSDFIILDHRGSILGVTEKIFECMIFKSLLHRPTEILGMKIGLWFKQFSSNKSEYIIQTEVINPLVYPFPSQNSHYKGVSLTGLPLPNDLSQTEDFNICSCQYGSKEHQKFTDYGRYQNCTLPSYKISFTCYSQQVGARTAPIQVIKIVDIEQEDLYLDDVADLSKQSNQSEKNQIFSTIQKCNVPRFLEILNNNEPNQILSEEAPPINHKQEEQTLIFFTERHPQTRKLQLSFEEKANHDLKRSMTKNNENLSFASSSKSDNSQNQAVNLVRQISNKRNISGYFKYILAINIIFYLYIYAYLIVSLESDSYNLSKLSSDLNSVKVPNRFNRIYCTFLILGSLDVQKKILNISLSDYFHERIRRESKLIRAEVLEILKELKLEFSHLDEQGNFQNLPVMVFTLYELQVINMTMIQFDTMFNEQTQRLNYYIQRNNLQDLEQQMICLMFLQNNLKLQLDLNKYLINQLRDKFYLSVEFYYNQNFTLFLTSIFLVILLIALQYRFWMKILVQTSQILLLICRINETEVHQINNQFQIVKKLLESNQWRYQDFKTFCFEKSEEQLEDGNLNRKKNTALITKIQQTKLNRFAPNLVMITLLILRFSLILTIYLVKSHYFDNSVIQMNLCMDFVDFKTSLDSLFVLSNVIKYSPVLLEKYNLSNSKLQRNDLKRVFENTQAELLVEFTIYLKQCSNKQITLLSYVVFSTGLKEDEKRMLKQYYEQDLCVILQKEIPFCSFDGSRFKYFLDLPEPQAKDDNSRLLKFGILGIFQNLFKFIENNYDFEQNGESNSNIQELYDLIDSDQYHQILNTYFLDLNKALIEGYNNVLQSSQNILKRTQSLQSQFQV